MRLTRWQLAELPKLISFTSPWVQRPAWTWQERAVIRELMRLARAGAAADVSRETIPDLAKKQARSKAYREGARKAARTKKLIAAARAAQAEAKDTGDKKAA